MEGNDIIIFAKKNYTGKFKTERQGNNIIIVAKQTVQITGKFKPEWKGNNNIIVAKQTIHVNLNQNEREIISSQLPNKLYR